MINLSVDKPAVFREGQVLRPGGRFGITDVVAEYRSHLENTGLTDVEIILTHPVADGLHSAIVKAIRPS